VTTIEHPERTLVIEREFNAPRDLVYEAWTNLDHIEKWWGPIGVSIKSIERDFSIGGVWRCVMLTPSGGEKPLRYEYLEILPPEKLVWLESWAENRSDEVQVTVRFEEQGDGTKLTMLILHGTAEEMKRNDEYGMRDGWNSSFESLDEFLESCAAA
jgi:uncharacterized protein YndB with AHSA1/START domain